METVEKTGKEVAGIAKKTTKELEPKKQVIVPADDLKKINGIGPKMAEILNMAGYGTYQQIATAEVKELEDVLEAAGSRYKKFDPTPWIEEAKVLAAGE